MRMKANLEQFLKKDEEFRKEYWNMTVAIWEEMTEILSSQVGQQVLFDAVDDIKSPDMYLIKGFGIKEGKIHVYLEEKDKPMVWLNSPYGFWYILGNNFGFKTTRILAGYLKLLRSKI